METEADRIVFSILHDIEDFRIEVGTLTLQFAEVEDVLAQSIVQIGSMSHSDGLSAQAEKRKVLPLRLLEKRDLLKAIIADAGRFYGVDSTRLLRLLDELGNLNRLRRTIVHGSIRWSSMDKRPVFVDSHGHSTSAWPWDVLEVNRNVSEWLLACATELRSFLIGTLENEKASIERLLNQDRFNSTAREFLTSLRSHIADCLAEANARCPTVS